MKSVPMGMKTMIDFDQLCQKYFAQDIRNEFIKQQARYKTGDLVGKCRLAYALPYGKVLPIILAQIPYVDEHNKEAILKNIVAPMNRSVPKMVSDIITDKRDFNILDAYVKHIFLCYTIDKMGN